MERLRRYNYYDNSHHCFECSGEGCKLCNATGVTRWPLSRMVNNAVPPNIKEVVSTYRLYYRANYIARETEKLINSL